MAAALAAASRYPFPRDGVNGLLDHLLPAERAGLPSRSEAEKMLNAFRSQIAPFFPFVIVPPDISATELQQQKPFLYRNVMMASFLQDPPRQTSLALAIREYVGRHVIVNDEQSLDILQGLLVYLAWSDAPYLPDIFSANR